MSLTMSSTSTPASVATSMSSLNHLQMMETQINRSGRGSLFFLSSTMPSTPYSPSLVSLQLQLSILSATKNTISSCLQRTQIFRNSQYILLMLISQMNVTYTRLSGRDTSIAFQFLKNSTALSQGTFCCHMNGTLDLHPHFTDQSFHLFNSSEFIGPRETRINKRTYNRLPMPLHDCNGKCGLYCSHMGNRAGFP